MPIEVRFRDEWLVPIVRDNHGVDAEFIEAARAAGHPFLATALVRRGSVKADALGASVERVKGWRFVNPATSEIDRALLKTVSERICRQHHLVPLAIEPARIHLASANPGDLMVEDELRFATGRKPVMAYCLPERIDELLASVLTADRMIFDLLRTIDVSQPVELLSGSVSGDMTGDVEAPVIKLVNAIIAKAVDLGASDIHIEHEERASQVRYRVDGVLRVGLHLPRYLAAGPVASRFKIMAAMDVAERRRPQDGQAMLRVGGSAISLRVSTLPTQFGEKVVARVLDARNARAGLRDVGLSTEIVTRFERQLARGQGFVLVTGPTGSGKTTTLYAAISTLADGATNIVSIEDPIEYQLGGISQVQINTAQGLTFATTLRSALRQDPDVILVGEIRDRETADIACQAAMTGHLVFSTLHTNDAIGAVLRLVDMGVDRFKIAGSLSAVVAQRLAARLCECRLPRDAHTLPPLLREALQRHGLPVAAYERAGCPQCQFTGLRKRVPVAEFLEMTPELTELVSGAPSANEVRTKALAAGALVPLEKDALRHLSEGRLSVDDAMQFLDQAPVSDGQSAAGLSPRACVVLADANPGSRERATRTLLEAGFDVVAVTDGGAAIAGLVHRTPDVLVVAMPLPVVAGIDLIRYARGTLGLATLPIIALGEGADPATESAAVAAGADEVFAADDFERRATGIVKAALSRGRDFSPASAIRTAPVPPGEPERLATLHRTGLLDSPREERFDAITRLAAHTFGTPVALVTLIDRDRQWFKSNHGLAVNETPRQDAFCAHAILGNEVMVINDAALDARFAENPLVTGDPHIRFYAGVPVSTPDGQRLGTLCVIDQKPRTFSDSDRQALEDFGRLVQREIASHGA
jgi:type IV pilus assembly protein PilB